MPPDWPTTSRRAVPASLSGRLAARNAGRTAFLTSAAILCFAANSIFCRLALAPDLIDPATFTTVRILSAAVLLTAGVWGKYHRLPRRAAARPRSIAAVFVY